MPIKVPEALPAVTTLENENIFVMTEQRALHQDIRALKIAVLNLMPTKIVTETQLIRLLSNTSLQVDLTLIYPDTAQAPKHTPHEHMEHFYSPFSSVRNKKFDGLIITGAPVENLDFEDVLYWEELKKIMDWSRTNVFSTVYICWAAQAALYYFYGIPKYKLDKKAFGVFKHRVLEPSHPLVRGFDEEFYAPHSRHTKIDENAIDREKRLKRLARSDKAGTLILADDAKRQFFITGHLEYDYDTLSNEYFRDKGKGLDIDPPENYFPDGDETKTPVNFWRAHAHLLFANWLNYCVYQMTPYDIEKISPTE